MSASRDNKLLALPALLAVRGLPPGRPDGGLDQRLL